MSSHGFPGFYLHIVRTTARVLALLEVTSHILIIYMFKLHIDHVIQEVKKQRKIELSVEQVVNLLICVVK